MEPCLVYPSTPMNSLVQALEHLGLAWTPASSLDEVSSSTDSDSFSVCIVETSAEGAFGFCRSVRANEFMNVSIVVVAERYRLAELHSRTDLFDEFVCVPVDPYELDSRIKILLTRKNQSRDSEIITYGPLALNTETYQAAIAGRPLDLTYMEYELLRFFASNPGKVFTRETLLNRVWGYDYYGGARTVDVHVRRLRAKLGEEHANLIQTVRSVGYRFGNVRWGGVASPQGSTAGRRPQT